MDLSSAHLLWWHVSSCILPFLIGLFFFCFILRVHYMFKILVLCQICCLQILLLICVCLFILISECFKKKNKWMLHKTKDFNFDEVQLVKFSSIDFTFCVKSIISLLSPESWGFSLSLFFSWNCYCVGFILQSVVHLEINLHKLWVSVETPFFVFCLLMPSNLFWKD